MALIAGADHGMTLPRQPVPQPFPIDDLGRDEDEVEVEVGGAAALKLPFPDARLNFDPYVFQQLLQALDLPDQGIGTCQGW